VSDATKHHGFLVECLGGYPERVFVQATISDSDSDKFQWWGREIRYVALTKPSVATLITAHHICEFQQRSSNHC